MWARDPPEQLGSPRSTTLRALEGDCARGYPARGSPVLAQALIEPELGAVDPASIAGGTKDCRRAAGGRNCLEPVAHDLKAHCMGSSWIEKGSPAIRASRRRTKHRFP